MRPQSTSLLSALAAGLALVACDAAKTGEGATASSAAPVKTVASAKPTATAGACPTGCKGKGTFSEMCRCEGASLPPVPFEAKRGEGYRYDKPVKDKSSHQCISLPAPPEDRPKGG